MIPKVNLSKKLPYKKMVQEGQKLIEAFKDYGACRVQTEFNDDGLRRDFLEVSEEFFATRSRQLMINRDHPNIRKECKYQLGLVPSECLVPKVLSKKELKTFVGDQNQPTRQSDGKDRHMRFFHCVGDSEAEELNSLIDISDIKNMKEIYGAWGDCHKRLVGRIVSSIEMGLSLEADVLFKKCSGATDYLAPTGTPLKDLSPGDTIANVHRNINFITIISKGNLPGGLYLWDSKRNKLQVDIQENEFLALCGYSLAYLTAGLISANYHESVYDEIMQEEAKKTNAKWRIASVYYSMLNKNTMFQPLPELGFVPNSNHRFPSIRYSQFLNDPFDSV